MCEERCRCSRQRERRRSMLRALHAGLVSSVSTAAGVSYGSKARPGQSERASRAPRPLTASRRQVEPSAAHQLLAWSLAMQDENKCHGCCCLMWRCRRRGSAGSARRRAHASTRRRRERGARPLRPARERHADGGAAACVRHADAAPSAAQRRRGRGACAAHERESWRRGSKQGAGRGAWGRIQGSRAAPLVSPTNTSALLTLASPHTLKRFESRLCSPHSTLSSSFAASAPRIS
jgi:hypothetical protein